MDDIPDSTEETKPLEVTIKNREKREATPYDTTDVDQEEAIKITDKDIEEFENGDTPSN